MTDSNQVGIQTDPGDTRPDVTIRVTRGVMRALRDLGFEVLTEVGLKNNRRADVMGLGPKGEIWIVEVKSSREDLMVDSKWPEYREFCDCLFFGVSPDFPEDLLPDDTGLIFADAHGGEVVREAPDHPLAGARRKAVLIMAARKAAERLYRLNED